VVRVFGYRYRGPGFEAPTPDLRHLASDETESGSMDVGTLPGHTASKLNLVGLCRFHAQGSMEDVWCATEGKVHWELPCSVVMDSHREHGY
jgi:hypothetical protein